MYPARGRWNTLVYTVKYGRLCVVESAFPITDNAQREPAAEFSKVRLPSR
jgi:hypothetical protein